MKNCFKFLYKNFNNQRIHNRFYNNKLSKYSAKISSYRFSTKNENNEENLQIENNTQSNTNPTNIVDNERIQINLNDIKGTRTSDSGYLVLSFTCKKCETKNTKKFSKKSYTEGIVLIQCDCCKVLHLIADNLGWFEDESVNIEDLMKRKGEEIKKITCDGLFNLVEGNNKV